MREQEKETERKKIKEGDRMRDRKEINRRNRKRRMNDWKKHSHEDLPAQKEIRL